MNVEAYIEGAKSRVADIIRESDADGRTVLMRYTAAIAPNFTRWMAWPYPWARHEVAQYALKDNLRCEITEDHIGMLRCLSELSDAVPGREHEAFSADEVAYIDSLFASDINSSGLTGVALMACLENTSLVFIPDLAEKAQACGCGDLTYTDVHGEADKEHGDAFTEAVIAEMATGYTDPELVIRRAVDAGVALMRKIYAS